MSMAMGAFLAGVMLSNSSYRHQIESDNEPFRGLLMHSSNDTIVKREIVPVRGRTPPAQCHHYMFTKYRVYQTSAKVALALFSLPCMLRPGLK